MLKMIKLSTALVLISSSVGMSAGEGYSSKSQYFCELNEYTSCKIVVNLCLQEANYPGSELKKALDCIDGFLYCQQTVWKICAEKFPLEEEPDEE